ncbi:MAG TPA: ATP-binding cassette domain-containing protein [Mycobacteriales bacterium]|nr:ATP-binding cassette domain-containing protein [Mycobacteriales bacterium]
MMSARGLARTYKTRKGPVEAVRGVDLEVSEHEIVGFLGPNGAGKTTTLRMLTTLLKPTAGEATVAGCDLLTDPVGVRRRIGYVAQGGSSAPEATVGEELVDHAMLYGMSRADSRASGEQLIAQLDLDGLWNRQTKALSGGQRRRLDVAMGLVHGAKLVFLDEPTTGLDPQARANLWDHVRRLRDDLDSTVFLTTHYLEEADALCDRILIIDNGEIVAEGTPDDLKRRVSGDVVTLRVPDETQTPDAVRVAKGLTTDDEPEVDGVTVRFRVDSGAEILPRLLRELDSASVTLAGVEVHRPTLDDVFLTLTGRTLRDDAA